jgi:hypothetical protein
LEEEEECRRILLEAEEEEEYPVQGTFYVPELQRVRKDVNKIFRGEKILMKRRRNGPAIIPIKYFL